MGFLIFFIFGAVFILVVIIGFLTGGNEAKKQSKIRDSIKINVSDDFILQQSMQIMDSPNTDNLRFIEMMMENQQTEQENSSTDTTDTTDSSNSSFTETSNTDDTSSSFSDSGSSSSSGCD